MLVEELSTEEKPTLAVVLLLPDSKVLGVLVIP
jgi:hypothetical protein